MPLLRAERVRVEYGQIAAVNDVSLEVESGEIVALLGPNGAGKTTLLDTIGGLRRPSSGTVWFDGRDITRIRGDLVARRGISLVPEGRGIFPALSVEDNLRMGGYWAADDYEPRFARAVEYFPVLETRRRQQAGSLSGGEQQQLAIARALMSQPRLLMLDEMSLGLAPRIVAELFDILRRIHADGTSVLLVEQHVPQALALAQRVYVLQRGRVALSGSSAEVGADARALSAAYLGDGERPGAGSRPQRAHAAPDQERLDVVELESLTVPLSLRDKRALQVLADRSGEPVGALVGRLIAEHVARQRDRAAQREASA
ncbi:MAG TPA: ABC transporter ATP-binding protein [Candidatus Dormibacteraeota bacterium]|nr:ABC transporter ATP-binding protein [Candidatus Dormibacteraeota bacterium]